MAAYLPELRAQLHTLGTGAIGQEQKCGEGKDEALFDELFECYFDMNWASQADQRCEEDEGRLNQAWQPRLSAAKTEVVYQTLIDLGSMLTGHEPLDPTHMDHLRKTIPEMIRGARGQQRTTLAFHPKAI
ncbi:hypothetical protein DFQ27_005450 [Actinomortierella ambigua]|uniref:Uncharacterized protein n=1 Tax=Actinomortierella ambigua TaxID=1343610 RepID=A0A9P6QM67_9FUNG|nr:hypothetical protein DFQ27_005450 [Actinomortierella ambigua]